MIKYSLLVLNLAGSLLFGNFTNAMGEFSTVNITVDSVSVMVKRTFPENAGTDYKVQLLIRKGNLTGFGKIQENIPEGLIATADQLKDGSFSFSDQKVKIVWVNLPAEEEFTVTYNVHASNSQVSAKGIDGVFSYIENDETRKFLIPESSGAESMAVVPATGNAPASSTESSITPPATSNAGNSGQSQDLSQNTNPVTPSDVPAKKEEMPASNTSTAPAEVKTEPAAIQTPPATENKEVKTEVPSQAISAAEIKKESETPLNPVETKANIPTEEKAKVTEEELARIVAEKKKEAKLNSSSSSDLSEAPVSSTNAAGIVFKVQIAALQNSNRSGWLKNRYHLSKIETEQGGEMTKYLSGSFGSYEAAKEFRDRIKSEGAEGAFITAYRGGKRISLNEAVK